MLVANDNTNTARGRFDAELVTYLPSMRRQARVMMRSAPDGEELLQDTVASMLSIWDRCRIETFRTWAQIMLRRTASDKMKAARAEKRSGRYVGIELIDQSESAAPEQEVFVELNQTLSALEAMPHGAAAVRYAMGDTLKEIGAERGVSREAARQQRDKVLYHLKDIMKRAA
jgi:RNA polymerase sigma factor (sigma-70 family)